MASMNWIVEALVQFSSSPVWQNPVQNFIDDNCQIFVRESEMKFEYTTLHKKFCTLVDTLLSDFLNELGVPLEEALDSIIAFTAHHQTPKKDRAVARAQRMLKYIFSVDDFLCFYTLMVKRNIELELMACASLKASGILQDSPTLESVSGQPVQDDPIVRETQLRAIEVNGDIDDDEALQRALQLSMQDAELSEKRVQLEKATAEKEMAFKQQTEKERERVRNTEVVSESKGLEVTKSRGHRHRRRTSSSQDAAKSGDPEDKAAVPSAAGAPLSESSSRKTTSAPNTGTASASASASAAVQSQTSAAPPPLVMAPAAEVVVPVCASTTTNHASIAQSAPQISGTPITATASDDTNTQPSAVSAAPAASKEIFGQKALPPIAGSDVLNPATMRQRHTRAPAHDSRGPRVERTRHESASVPASASPEELQKRALYMKQQREKIIDMNKNKRQKNLDDYVKENNVQTVLNKDGTVAAPEQKLTIDIARRLREDILEEARK